MRAILRFTRIALIASLCLSVIACSNSYKWEKIDYLERYTYNESCRVHKKIDVRGVSYTSPYYIGDGMGIFSDRYLYAENFKGEIRAGIFSKSQGVLPGDVQINIGDKSYLMSLDDTPVYMNADLFDYINSGANDKEGFDLRKQFSPYRAYSGEKAKELIRGIINNRGDVTYQEIRKVRGKDATKTQPVLFKTKPHSFRSYLKKCDINVN